MIRRHSCVVSTRPRDRLPVRIKRRIGPRRRRRARPPSSPRDHISALPDDVITRIFSYLPFKDVVKTSALSRRWRYTWKTTTRHLEFDGVRYPNPLGFQSHVDRVLNQFASTAVKKFHITHVEYSKANDPVLERWLRVAEKHGVEDLRLWLFTGLRSTYALPQFLFCWDWLVRLEVRLCRFSLGTTIMWPCLKVLSMVKVKLSDDILERIFRGSPVLESLELRGCWGMKNIRIDSTSVKDLLLIRSGFSNLEKITAPHLLSLCVSGTWRPLNGRGGISLDDVYSLVEAKLDFVILTGGPGERTMCCDLLKELLEKLRGVPTITIGGWCLQILSHLERKGVPSPLSKCQNLILHAPVSQRDVPGIAYMLRSSPCLEKLVIHLPRLSRSKLKLDEESIELFNFDEKEFSCLRKGEFECLANHLKRVEINDNSTGRFWWRRLLVLIKLLIEDAHVLEKLVVKVKSPGTDPWWKVNFLSGFVRRFPIASKNAELLFYWEVS